jgi:hypothetical protein
MNAVKRKRRVNRVFIELAYRPKAAFCALKMAVILSEVSVDEYTMEVDILPV